MSRVAGIEGLHITNVTPVGIQPFQRCERQSAYVIETGQTYDMLKDQSFTKVKFKLSPEICEWIYSEMNGGELVYPNEGKGNCQDIADTISKSFSHTEEAFNGAVSFMKLDQTEAAHLKQRLEAKGYSFSESISWCTQKRQQELETICSNSAKEIDSSFRLMFCI